MFWVIGRIVNIKERRALMAELNDVENVLFVDPPLSKVHCLKPYRAANPNVDMLVYAQAQNAIRNAVLRHAKSIKAHWVFPLDGNILLPETFFDTLISRIQFATSHGFDAVLVPVLRQTGGSLGTDVDALGNSTRGAIVRALSTHRRLSKPQLAFRVNSRIRSSWSTAAKISRVVTFDESWSNGDANTTSFIRDVCALRRSTTMCCHMIHNPTKPTEEYSGRDSRITDAHLATGYACAIALMP